MGVDYSHHVVIGLKVKFRDLLKTTEDLKKDFQEKLKAIETFRISEIAQCWKDELKNLVEALKTAYKALENYIPDENVENVESTSEGGIYKCYEVYSTSTEWPPGNEEFVIVGSGITSEKRPEIQKMSNYQSTKEAKSQLKAAMGELWNEDNYGIFLVTRILNG